MVQDTTMYALSCPKPHEDDPVEPRSSNGQAVKVNTEHDDPRRIHAVRSFTICRCLVIFWLWLLGCKQCFCSCVVFRSDIARPDFAACQRPLRSRKSIFRIGQRFCKISQP